jgi:hypothetical protein
MISKNIKESPFLEKWDRKKIYEIITRDGFLSGKERAEDQFDWRRLDWATEIKESRKTTCKLYTGSQEIM